MEAERRSTMSSLKGQLSNVEGSVKSMKVAVVVGSVLTVACLAAVFGVTVLANEVSKEVKVSNGTLTSKSGQAVLTTSSVVTKKADLGVETLVLENASFKVNAVVVNGETTTLICDDLVAVQKNGETSTSVAEGSVLASILGEEAFEKRRLNFMPHQQPTVEKEPMSDEVVAELAICAAAPIACLVGKGTQALVTGFIGFKRWLIKEFQEALDEIKK